MVAHENPAFCDAVRKVLAAEPFSIISINDGSNALVAIRNQKPQVALLDVALPGKFGFEICEELKKNPATSCTKIILIAAVYDGARYKRSPQSLYGADDYIEKHHIPDELAGKIHRLIAEDVPTKVAAVDSRSPESPPLDVEPVAPLEQKIIDEVRQELKAEESAPVPPAELSDAHKKAQRLARIIASDIALYNQAKVEEGIRSGNFFNLLSDDIQEGTALYHRRVPEEIRSATRYLQEAFDNLIEKKKKELNLH